MRTSRRLLNIKKIISKFDSKKLNLSEDETFVLVTMEPVGIIAKPNVQEKEFVLFNINLLYTLSSILRQLNFVEHTSDIGRKEYQRAKPVIIDPGLYNLHKLDVFWITEKRSVATEYKLSSL